MAARRALRRAYERIGHAIGQALGSASAVAGRAAETRGEHTLAASRYLEAGLGAEASRCLERAAELAPRPLERLGLLARARDALPPAERGSLAERVVVLRAELADAGTLDLTPPELAELASELEAAGEVARAARMYAKVGDAEGEARARIAAGDVEGLEAALAAHQARERLHRRVASTTRRARDLALLGRRRDALSACAELGAGHQAVADEIMERRAVGPVVELVLSGAAVRVALRSEVCVGRSDADVVVAGPGVSRRHLILRRIEGQPHAEDLGSRNGTFVAGARLTDPLPIRGRTELSLGDGVAIVVEPWAEGVRLEVGGAWVHAPLGPLELGAGAQLHLGADGWVRATVPVGASMRLGSLHVDGELELLRGDQLLDAEGAVVVEIRG